MNFEFNFNFKDERGHFQLTVTPTNFSSLSNRSLTSAERDQLLEAAHKFEGIATYLRKAAK